MIASTVNVVPTTGSTASVTTMAAFFISTELHFVHFETFDDRIRHSYTIDFSCKVFPSLLN